MARKALKREPTACQETAQDNLVSSGDTIVVDTEVAEGPIDEGYHTNHENTKNSNQSSAPLPQTQAFHSNVTSPNTECGLELMGRGVKELVQRVQSLRHLGVENLVLPLPKIVVVGDQSTGKSSLIEAISEIKVPRSAGTCTRCPLEINLTETTDPDEQWSCDVFLNKKYIYQGNLGVSRSGKSTAKVEGATKTRPLGPWLEQDSEDLHFASLTEKSEVVDVLERAQLATLNPGSSYEKYKPGNHILREHQVKFSPNVIRLDISGPRLPNLSFYDLPGIINVTDISEEAYLVDLVRNLVKDYIKAENCVNLLALTMTHDAANSSAFGLIKEMKAVARTIGCLTKPDRREPGEALDHWIRILRGEEFQLGFGYHVIKNNPNPEVDHVTARKEEATFFDETEPWTTMLKAHRYRCGIPQLQIALSEQLTVQIRRSLPNVIEKVQQKADSIEASLKELPEPLDGNLLAIVYGELFKFEGEIKERINGGPQDNSYQKESYNLAQAFRKVLADSRPILMLQTPGTPIQSSRDTPSTPTRRPVFTIESDSEGGNKSGPSAPSSGRKRPHPSTQSTPNKYSRTIPRHSQGHGVLSRSFSLSEVREIILDTYTGLPNETHPKAIEKMIKLSQEHWHEPVEQFLWQTRKLCQNMVFEQVLKVFGHHQQTRFYDQIVELCEAFFDKAMLQQSQVAKDILSWELSRPYTLNREALDAAREKSLTLLQTRRREIRARDYLVDQEAKTGKATSGQARAEKLSKMYDDEKLPPDTYVQEILAMSTVKGYYECAYNRFVDNLYGNIHCGPLSKCGKEIPTMVKNRFGVLEAGANERLALLLAADPEQEQRRAQLRREMEIIQKAQEHLEGLTENP